MMPYTKNAQMAPPANKGATRALDKKVFNPPLLLTHLSKFKKNHRNVHHDAFYQNCTNGSAPPNKGAAGALDKTYL